ncbi:formimidoylglutamase [Robertkochia aurantiaca]|uniref:formimidoylglutamase n=1 Tax=Robertkochia aurantiaca TaxID=2873700 RepID=UPI001CCE8B18|nr:formimidoylglutamase [Robertkochia sp. 3YJGBD-33]
MNFDFLAPVANMVLAHRELLPKQSIGKKIRAHGEKSGVPDLEGVKIALIGIAENRNSVTPSSEKVHLNEIRLQFYNLFQGNWDLEIADLGDIPSGESVSDSYYALSEVAADLMRQQIIPVVLGGSQDLTYALYRAYDKMEQMVNLVSVDRRFDFGDADDLISSKSYLSKIIVNPPNNLFNYSNIGYQTYLNAQEEIDLMEKLFFDAYRLGEVAADLSLVETVMRDADLVSLDMGGVRAADLGSPADASPNGFDGREICAIARYAGISDKLSCLGLFETFNTIHSFQLAAQIIWYFIEGVSIRKQDYPIVSAEDFNRYTVPMDDLDLIFLQSHISGRWWIEVPQIENLHNKFQTQTLLPCTHAEYLQACDGIIPERWWKAYKKMLV